MSKKIIKLFDPTIGKQEEFALKKILTSKFWASGSGHGVVSKFEKKFKEYVKSNSCVAVNSGTAALYLAFSLFNLKNKEVILPSMSFVSTAHCIIENGGIPVFADTPSNDPDTIYFKAQDTFIDSILCILRLFIESICTHRRICCNSCVSHYLPSGGNIVS